MEHIDNTQDAFFVRVGINMENGVVFSPQHHVNRCGKQFSMVIHRQPFLFLLEKSFSTFALSPSLKRFANPCSRSSWLCEEDLVVASEFWYSL